MQRTEVKVIETTVQKTNFWLKELSEHMGWSDQHLSYIALRAVLHALRDRLPIEVVAKLGAQLPMLIRGIYYEGWVPAHTPIKVHRLEDFLSLVANYLGNDLLFSEIAQLTKNVFIVMENHLTEGEIDHLKKVLPGPITSFFSP
ncbi:DUF2267 domain-containing protein [Candidatus Protochlamydia amoebophila]|uniref:DUF2267 domain-containing protein n=1 Tax=Protochlamydia amoebophila (strain UWE25) TaxID=264201 RepID=Q6MCX0_PARUW|nr:DUF2267 domain-containing protein [Candidatus Protochlamydia amoebophila]CAF23579.1 unnamed protein product [Candidatus Protochlamydia amoebophila UWE25]